MTAKNTDNIMYYRMLAPIYDTIVPRDVKGVCDSVDEIITKRHKKKKQLLDLGCGTGRFTIELAKRGYDITGLDITGEMLRIAKASAKRNNLKIKFITADIRNFKLPRKAWIIWARGSIGDIIDPAHVKKAFLSIKNNLRVNGLFIFDVRDFKYHFKRYKTHPGPETRIIQGINRKTTFTFDYRMDKNSRIGNIVEETTIKDSSGIKKYRAHHQLRHYTKREIANLVRCAGFKILEILSGYKYEVYPKPRIVVIAEK